MHGEEFDNEVEVCDLLAFFCVSWQIIKAVRFVLYITCVHVPLSHERATFFVVYMTSNIFTNVFMAFENSFIMILMHTYIS
jgi:hypothetical protein